MYQYQKLLKIYIKEVVKSIIQEQATRRTIASGTITLNMENIAQIAAEIQRSWDARPGGAFRLSRRNIARIAEQFNITQNDVGDVVHALGGNTEGIFGTPEGMRRALTLLPPPAPPPFELSSLRGRFLRLMEGFMYLREGDGLLQRLQSQGFDLVFTMQRSAEIARQLISTYPATARWVSPMITEYERIAQWASRDPLWGRIAGTLSGPLPADWEERFSLPGGVARRLIELQRDNRGQSLEIANLIQSSGIALTG